MLRAAALAATLIAAGCSVYTGRAEPAAGAAAGASAAAVQGPPRHAPVNQCAPETTGERLVETRHTVRADTGTLSYTARAGLLPLRESVAGETLAHVFYVAYTLERESGAPARPLTFVWNGGPGAPASLLYLTGLGPRVVRMADDVRVPPSKTELEDNAETWLAHTDLVFVDPVGTGYSRPVRADLGARFWSDRGDAESIAEFIRAYLVRFDAWDAPLFVAGESYGAARAAAMAEALPRRGIRVAGTILISAVFAPGSSDTRAAYTLPAFTAAAFAHGRLAPELQADLQRTLRQAERFAVEEYAPALAARAALSAARQRELAAQLARFTGLPLDQVLDLQLDRQAFARQLFGAEPRVLGSYDARITRAYVPYDGPYDPREDASLRMTLDLLEGTSVLLRRYLAHDLGFHCDLPYLGPFGRGWPAATTFRGDWMTMRWDRTTPEAQTETSEAILRAALLRDPALRVFVAMGVYDLVTTYFAAESAIAQLDLPADRQAHIRVVTYEGGHAPYHDRKVARQLRQDVAAFIAAARAVP